MLKVCNGGKTVSRQDQTVGASGDRVVKEADLAESEGFEPPDLLQSTVFKTAAFDHSANSPMVIDTLPGLYGTGFRCFRMRLVRRITRAIPALALRARFAHEKSLTAIFSTTLPTLRWSSSVAGL